MLNASCFRLQRSYQGSTSDKHHPIRWKDTWNGHCSCPRPGRSFRLLCNHTKTGIFGRIQSYCKSLENQMVQFTGQMGHEQRGYYSFYRESYMRWDWFNSNLYHPALVLMVRQYTEASWKKAAIKDCLMVVRWNQRIISIWPERLDPHWANWTLKNFFLITCFHFFVSIWNNWLTLKNWWLPWIIFCQPYLDLSHSLQSQKN